MKILQVCQFSSGACGVWSRVLQDSIELVKRGHEVYVFSSNQIKGKNELADKVQIIDGVNIKRFPVIFQIGENCLFWNFKSKLEELKPDIIIAHCYRHPYTNKIIKYAEEQNRTNILTIVDDHLLKQHVKTFLITHATFVPKKLRGLKLHLFTLVYDLLFKRILNKFDKVIRITDWESPYLEKLGCNNSILIPNGIPDIFFGGNIKGGEGILFLGRIAPVKNVECLIEAVKDLDVDLDIVGPYEEKYWLKLQDHLCISNKARISFEPPVYNTDDKIKLIDYCNIFVLPSKREGMPTSLIEAMARGKICIASDTDGAKEVIKDNFNGFLFKNDNAEDLKNHIEFILKLPNNEKLQIGTRARKSVEQFKISKIVDKLEGLFI